MQLTPYLHIGTGATVYIEGDSPSPDFRPTGSPFEARTAPFDEDKPKLKQALKEAKKWLQDQHAAKIAMIQSRIDTLGAENGQ
jgi:hypothetical protein